MSPGAVKGGGRKPQKALRRPKILAHLLPSRLYCRYRSCAGSCARGARGLYRRSGISPCPEDICSLFSFRNRQYTTIPPKMQAGCPRCHIALPRWAVELRPVVFAWHLSGPAWGAKKVGEVRCPDGHTLFAFLHTTCPAQKRSMTAQALGPK